MVRVAGVEPALLSELDFESSASTNSTTPAQVQRSADLQGEGAGFNWRNAGHEEMLSGSSDSQPEWPISDGIGGTPVCHSSRTLAISALYAQV